MGTLQIDGIGSVEVGPEFARLDAAAQAATVDQIIAQIKGGPQAAAAAGPDVSAIMPAGSENPPPAAPPPEPGVAAAAGRIATRAGEVASERMGDQPFGLSEQTIKELQEKGALAAPGAAPTPIQLLNHVVYQFGAKAGDALLRTIGAGIGGLAGAAEQGGIEAGMDQGMARRLGRDVGTGVEVAGMVAGQPAAAVQQAVARGVAATQRAGAAEAAAARAAGPASAARTAEDFKGAARSFYQKADEAGVVVAPTSFRGVSDDIFTATAKAGLDPTLTPNSMAAVKRIQELADPKTGPLSFQTLDLARQIASDAKGAARASDQRIASIIVDKLDDYIAGLSAKDVVAGNAKVAAESIVQARQLWSTAKKLETVETLIQRAGDSAKTFSGSGFENALRTEFKNLAKNKKAMATFTADEQAAIRQVNRGTIPANFARGAGKLAPRGSVSAFTSGGVGAAIGTAVLGPGIGSAIGAGTAFGIGEVGRKVATVLAQRSIRRLEDVIRAGGDSPMASSAIKRSAAMMAQITGTAAPGLAGQSGSPQRDTSETADSRYRKVVAGLERVRAALGGDPTIEGGISMAMSAIPGAGALGAKLYTSLLKEAGTNRAAFDVVLNALRADKSLDAAALTKIAKEFANQVTNPKNKEDAFKMMMAAFVRRARFENKIAP